MSYCEWTERVAMAVDAPDAAVDAHVSVCQRCRGLLNDLLADAAESACEPEVPESALDLVRARVMERVRPSRWWLRAAAAFAALLGAGWWLARAPELNKLDIAISAPAAPELIRPAPRPHAVKVRKAPRPTQRAQDGTVLALALRDMLGPEITPTVSTSSPVVMRIQTEDPDVVIILFSDSKGAD